MLIIFQNYFKFYFIKFTSSYRILKFKKYLIFSNYDFLLTYYLLYFQFSYKLHLKFCKQFSKKKLNFNKFWLKIERFLEFSKSKVVYKTLNFNKLRLKIEKFLDYSYLKFVPITYKALSLIFNNLDLEKFKFS